MDSQELKPLISEMCRALEWYHLGGQNVKLHKRAMPDCGDCILISKAKAQIEERGEQQ